MSRISFLAVVLIFAFNEIGRADVPEQIENIDTYSPARAKRGKIHLTVYYESKCPDSRDFIVDQLQPAIGLLNRFIKLQMVPFGKADSINGGQNFKCQHGPSECLGNLVQDCALAAMGGRSDEEKVAYVACEMETRAGTTRKMLCVKQHNIPVDVVEKCVSSKRGVELQLTSERLTKQIRPKFIPTVTFGKTFNQHIQDSSMNDLIGTICSMFKDRPICARHYNNRAMGELYE